MIATIRKLKTAAVIVPFLLLILSGIQMSAVAAEETRSGEFTGLSDHKTTGTASIIKTDDGYVIKLGADFTFDGAPDPKVALGKDGNYDSKTLIRLLDSNTGEQTYVVPDSIDVSAYNEVYIWCEKYDVGLGVASLN